MVEIVYYYWLDWVIRSWKAPVSCILQILPILTYGCAIWGLPKENNYIYLTGLKECTEYKDIIYKYIDKKNILFCKRVGKITQLPRKVLIKCSSFAIKENLFRLNALDENNVPFHVENYNLSVNEKCDKMHASYCKFVLNLDKFTSNFAARAELGSFPISLFIWTTCIKYWHRMEKGIKELNYLLLGELCENSANFILR